MADSLTNSQQKQYIALNSNTNTQSALTDESYNEIPHKPNGKSSMHSNNKPMASIIQASSLSLQASQQNLTIKYPNSSILSQEAHKIGETSTYNVMSEGCDIQLDCRKVLQQSNGLINNVLNSGYTKMMPKILNNDQSLQARSSINSYNKRVVELNAQNNDDVLKVQPQTTKSAHHMKLSLDLSEIPLADVLEIQAKVNEIKQRIAMNKVQQQQQQLSSCVESTQLSNEKNESKQKVMPISQNISPKTQNLFPSPRQQINSCIGNKSKLAIRKQAVNQINAKPNLISLNKSDQLAFGVNITQDVNNTQNQSQHVLNCKVTSSPQIKQLIHQATKSNLNSNIKQSIDQSQSSSQLLRNLSNENKSLRISQSIKDLASLKKPESNGVRTHRIQVDLDTKRESLRVNKQQANINPYRSPNQISLNKALSRISSVGELKNAKDQIAQSRKSINMSKQSISNIAGNSTVNQVKKAIQRKQSQATYLKPVNQNLTKDQEELRSQDSEENEYMTNQERLWNAIETNASLEAIEELLKKSDVNVNAKNVFDDGWTALHYAAHEGKNEIVRILIENYGATIDPRSSANKTPFHLACIRGDSSLISYLLDLGVSTSVVDRDGCTPLHYLCDSQNYEIVKQVLQKCGLSREIRNRFGKKPIDLIQDKDLQRALRRETSVTQQRRDSIAQRKSISRERSVSNHQKVIRVVSLKEDSEVQNSIQQMFRKFSLFNQKKKGDLSTRNKEIKSGLDIELDKKIEEMKQNLKAKAMPVSQMNSPQNQLPQQKKVQLYTNRLTLNPNQQKQNQTNNLRVQPQSCKNSLKSVQSKLFPTSSQNSNLVSKNVSPNRANLQLNSARQQQPQSKISSLNNSSSQRDLKNNSSVNTSKSSLQTLNQKRLTSIKSVNSLLQNKLENKKDSTKQQQTNEIQEVDENINEGNDDYTNQRQTSQVQIYSPDQKNYHNINDENTAGNASQRTVESSQIGGLNNDAVLVNQNHKLTTFSLNQLSDRENNQETQSIEDKNKDENSKIGPWSFIAHQLLGTGSFGEVFLVEKISNGKFYAMKVLTKAKIMGHNLTRYAMTERNVMSIVDHPFIVKLNYAFQTAEKLFLILDYCPGGDLAEYLQLEKRFNEDKVRIYSSEILIALESLHRKDIIFRDLKPDNVVLDAEGHALLTDFGLSKEGVMKEGMAKSFCGSYAYLAPEMLKKLGHGKAVDWYLLGVIIYEMLCGIPPYYANNKEELFENIKHSQLDIPSYISPLAKDLMIKLLNRNPKKRLGTLGGADEIKKHPFFKNIDWSKLYNRCYKPPEPYLKKRFDNFLSMSPELQTNAEVYEQLRKQAQFTVQTKEQHVPGWSFVSPTRVHE